MQLFFYLFGVLTLAGAVQGFLAGSKASLIAGGLLGTLVLAGAYLSAAQPGLGYTLVAVGSFGMAGKFVPAFFKKGRAIWPAGVLGLLGLASLVLAVMGLVKG